MDGWTVERTDRRTDGWTHGQADQLNDVPMNGPTDGWMDIKKHTNKGGSRRRKKVVNAGFLELFVIVFCLIDCFFSFLASFFFVPVSAFSLLAGTNLRLDTQIQP